MARKPQKQRERRYVPEFVEERYAERVSVFYNMAVGPPPEEMTKAHPEIPLSHFRRWRFWIDAVVITTNRLILIEGKIRKPAEGIGQILLYRSLLTETPELEPWKLLPVEMVLVTPRPDPRIIKFANTYGINIVIWTRPWVQDYLRSVGMA